MHVWAPPPGPESQMDVPLRKLRARHVELRWTMPSFEPGLTARPSGPTTVEDVVLEAVRIRVRASQSRAERAMRALGVRPKNVEVRRHGVRGGSE